MVTPCGATHALRAGAPMRLARAVLVAIALAIVGTPARADEVWRWRPFIVEASMRFGIPTRWIERVMRAESGGRPSRGGAPIRSRVGAMGLMQLMPATWGAMRAEHGLGGDPDDPRDNILAGTAYLRAMYDRFGYPGLFGAYNAGPGRYAAHLAGTAQLPAETIAYLASVAGADTDDARHGDNAVGASPVRPAPATLFAVVKLSPIGQETAQPTRQSGLFAIEIDARR